MMLAAILDKELQFYQLHRSELLEKHEGQVALIHGEDLIGTFPTDEEALSEGARRFGLVPFLVKSIRKEEPEVHIPALTLGILHAHP